MVEEVAAAVELLPAPTAMLWSADLNGSNCVAHDSAVGSDVAVDRRHDALAHTAGAGHSDLLRRIARRLPPDEHCYYSSDYVHRQHQHWDDHGNGCAPSLHILWVSRGLWFVSLTVLEMGERMVPKSEMLITVRFKQSCV